MRFDGVLTQWNDERGFGFIEPSQGGQPIFVHVSAFERNAARPRLDERFSFEITLAPDGRKQAIRVRRPEAAARSMHARPAPLRRSGRRGGWLLVMVVIVLGAFAYSAFVRQAEAEATKEPDVIVAAPMRPAATVLTFRCDGRIHCSQMTSCQEATYFLKHCPGVRMDGDNDGIACEDQWCR